VPDDGKAWTLEVVRDGVVEQSVAVSAPGVELRFEGEAPSRWRLQLLRGAVVAAVTSPIWLDAPRQGPVADAGCAADGEPSVRRARG
ncbi:MAG: hypothetical protein ACKO2K_20795, partial [Alphaproteobacteria bacterium]